jgi:hypothetical protein
MSIKFTDIITIPFDSLNEKEILKHAKSAHRVGGKSIIPDGQKSFIDRQQDDVIGQYGTAIGHQYWFGTDYFYQMTRFYNDLYLHSGDGGYDVPGAKIDFKASEIRNHDKPLLDYNLAIRPKERHKEWTYFLILINFVQRRGHIIGWATDEMLPDQPEADGIFKGAYIIKARELNPLPPVKWVL